MIVNNLVLFGTEREERKKKRLFEGLPPESESSSDEGALDDSLLQSRLETSIEDRVSKLQMQHLPVAPEPEKAKVEKVEEKKEDFVEAKVPKRRGRPPLKAKKSNELK